METATIAAILVAMVTAATPLVFAGVGELLTEKSGVLNLGVEGMMLMGAIAAFATKAATGSTPLALAAAMLSAACLALLFAILTLTLLANQVATGLALTIAGTGLSALLGKSYVGVPNAKIAALDLPGLSNLPLIGPVLFGEDPLVYLSVALVIAVAWFLNRSRAGLILRAVGENPDAAHAIGYPVIRIRYAATLVGGSFAGLGGAYLCLAYTPLWVQDITAGRGWIALALVVFSTWKPARLLFGAYLFGAFTIAQLHLQVLGFAVAPQLLAMLPYLATILVLVLISSDQSRLRLAAPAGMGQMFRPPA